MLIREAMQAPTPFELSRFVHMCGGRAVGSVSSVDDNTINCGPSTLPAILYDCTHDNETPTMVLLLYILYRKEHLKIHYQMVYYVVWHVLHVLVQEDMMKLYQEHYLLLKKEDYIKII